MDREKLRMRMNALRDVDRALGTATACHSATLADVIEDILAPSPPDGEAEREASSGRIERWIYKKDPEYARYLSARLGAHRAAASTFEWEGHRWRYGHTSFDDRGDYDLIWRPTPTPAPGEAQAAGDAVRPPRVVDVAFLAAVVASKGERPPPEKRDHWWFCRGYESALAARPAAVTEAMAGQIAEHVTGGIPFNDYDVVTTTKRDLEQRVRVAALAAGAAP